MAQGTSIDDLMARMTLAEKIGQLNLLSAGEGPETGSPRSRDIRARLAEGRLGALFGTKSVRSVRAWQELAVAGSRHGIPLLFAEDVIHGHRTIFPLPIALASSWDMALVEATARVAAAEAAAEGIRQVYAPMVDIARDARWGRIAESPGEDPFLAARYAEAMVRGLQGADLRAPDAVAACLKHFVAYGAAAGGRDYDNASLAPAELIGVYAEPFRAGVAAGAASVMAAFNAVNGQPMHAHRKLIDGWLRGTCGFEGLVVADYTGIHELMAHGIGDRETVAALALVAGVDIDMMGEDYLACLDRIAAEGLVRPDVGIEIDPAQVVEAIDRSCRRVLEMKERVGLFDDPFRYCDEARAARLTLAPAHRDLARRAAAACCVLLKNAGGVLPLAPGARVALIGRLADDRANMLGTWAVSGDPAEAATILEGLRETHDGEVRHAVGANLVDDPEIAARLDVFGPIVRLDPRQEREMTAEALALATDSDVVVLVAGEAKEHSGESASRTELDIPAPQRRLLEALAGAGKPVVLVVLAGRPLVLAREAGLADALVLGWFGGTEGGRGLADVLTGRAEPGGRLAVSLPARTGQVPLHHGAETTGRPWTGRFEKFRTGYLDLPDDVPPAGGLYPFGFGLGYTDFELDAPRVTPTRPTGGDRYVTVTVAVRNTGAQRGATVVQLYVTDPVARCVRPSRELKGFERVTLDPGEAREVAFTLGREDLAYLVGETIGTLERVWDPGTFVIHVGLNARDLRSVEIAWTP
ncbi:beta-glucosidase BglX [Limibaculum sp. FT325]|uniref:beta-glucosidase BglX n=1 Tax=Thermohalobaculum sediminis TaxID=2939436 RepID=UPI0020C0C1AE|nr:beta-glucosidase BglX [Limibaculum sediminis]MCL5778674.1 beta-glucosidase BglX [Limibaculum sediminis]